MSNRSSVSCDELAVPAICGQTGGLFLMVLRRRGPGRLELFRTIVAEGAQTVNRTPLCRADAHTRVPTRATNSAMPLNRTEAGVRTEYPPDPAFQPLTLRARIKIDAHYAGCPFCGATGYFNCSGDGCGMFSCWNPYNAKPHNDHEDVWCEGCQEWKCTSDGDSESELKAFAACENRSAPQRLGVAEATSRVQLHRSDAIRGYLK